MEAQREITIGRFTIIEGGYANNPDKVQIMLSCGGEGGDFALKDVEAVIEKYYNENL